jgi:hypothetical protein
MRGNGFVLILSIAFFLFIDWYVFTGVKALTELLSPNARKWIHISYWTITAWSISVLLATFAGYFHSWPMWFRTLSMCVIMVLLLCKIIFILFLLVDDLKRLVQFIIGKFSATGTVDPSDIAKGISRSDFLLKAGLVVSAIPFVGMTYGILVGAHDYTVRKKQLSDIHSGSFYNKTAVERGIALVMKQKPDIIFFTGDLVNNVASEMDEYIDVFSKLSAPLGIFSTLGNHDYGDYVAWDTPQAKRDNLNELIGVHKKMGWDILMNEHRILKKDGSEIAVFRSTGKCIKHTLEQNMYP